MVINPAMHRWPNEAAIIGRLVLAFGELEFMLADIAGQVTDAKNKTNILKALFRVRQSSARLDAADALLRPWFRAQDLENDYDTMMRAVRHCLKIRNQYAHAHWADDHTAGLFFTALEDAAQSSDKLDFQYLHVDVPLLMSQEAFFTYAQAWQFHFQFEWLRMQGTVSAQIFPKPEAQAPVSLHNPPLAHIPPWLGQDQKDLHVARAQAASVGIPTPTPGQQKLDDQRAQKQAQRAAQRAKAADGEKKS